MAVLLALCSALAFGAGVAAQQRAAEQAQVALSLRPGLLVDLVQRPAWLLGLVADIAGFGFQVAALRAGSLVVVQPILAGALVFALAFGSLANRQPLSLRDWTGVMGVVAGLALFYAVATPSTHSHGVAGPRAWGLTLGALSAFGIMALVVGLAAPHRRRASIRRAAWFGVAAGTTDAAMAALAKAFTTQLGHGVAATLASWAPYAVVSAGVLALLVTSSAYQVGHRSVTLPVISVTEPMLSVVVGISLFGERAHLGGLRAAGTGAAVLVTIGAIASLSRSPLVSSPPGDPAEPEWMSNPVQGATG